MRVRQEGRGWICTLEERKRTKEFRGLDGAGGWAGRGKRRVRWSGLCSKTERMGASGVWGVHWRLLDTQHITHGVGATLKAMPAMGRTGGGAARVGRREYGQEGISGRDVSGDGNNVDGTAVQRWVNEGCRPGRLSA